MSKTFTPGQIGQYKRYYAPKAAPSVMVQKLWEVGEALRAGEPIPELTLQEISQDRATHATVIEIISGAGYLKSRGSYRLPETFAEEKKP